MEGQGRDDPHKGGDDSKKNNQTTPPPDSIEVTPPKLEHAVTQFKTENGSYQFTLSGYSLAKGRGPGKYFSSGTFTVGGHEWAVYFYPDGKYDDDQSLYISVFIALVSASSDVQALFEIILLDQSGKGKHKSHSHFDRHFETPYTLKYQGSMWGYNRFIRRAVLEQSNFLKDDTLEFTGRVGVLLSSCKTTKLNTNPASPHSPLQHGFSSPSGDDDSYSEGSKHDGTAMTDSQLDESFEKKFEGLKLEDELARYYHKLNSNQSSTSRDVRSESHQEPAVN